MMTLADMVVKMREQVTNSDIEGAHWTADFLLVDALKLLAGTVALGQPAAQEISDLLDAYNDPDFSKWWA